MDSGLRPNSHYYISKVLVPPLNRCLSLVGADVLSWYAELPKCYRPRLVAPLKDPAVDEEVGESPSKRHQGVILNYFATRQCASCDTISHQPICQVCHDDPQSSVLALSHKIKEWDRAISITRKICQSCTGFGQFREDSQGCTSLDCPVFYKRVNAGFDAEQINYVLDLMKELNF
jgi:DNA polymerase zeta